MFNNFHYIYLINELKRYNASTMKNLKSNQTNKSNAVKIGFPVTVSAHSSAFIGLGRFFFSEVNYEKLENNSIFFCGRCCADYYGDSTKRMAATEQAEKFGPVQSDDRGLLAEYRHEQDVRRFDFRWVCKLLRLFFIPEVLHGELFREVGGIMNDKDKDKFMLRCFYAEYRRLRKEKLDLAAWFTRAIINTSDDMFGTWERDCPELLERWEKLFSSSRNPGRFLTREGKV